MSLKFCPTSHTAFILCLLFLLSFFQTPLLSEPHHLFFPLLSSYACSANSFVIHPQPLSLLNFTSCSPQVLLSLSFRFHSLSYPHLATLLLSPIICASIDNVSKQTPHSHCPEKAPPKQVEVPHISAVLLSHPGWNVISEWIPLVDFSSYE